MVSKIISFIGAEIAGFGLKIWSSIGYFEGKMKAFRSKNTMWKDKN